ncbi:hypothetical protein [Streptomyces sp. NPDC057748]|uniref:hypothetical protein n=1 Tax=unclassified Streptomyces TaxID=2593676 RepID=UPI0036D1A75A
MQFLDGAVPLADRGDNPARLSVDIEEAVRHGRRFRFVDHSGSFMGGAEAAVVGGGRLLDGFRQVVTEVPYIGDLDRLRGACLAASA